MRPMASRRSSTVFGDLSEKSFELGEGVLDRIEVRNLDHLAHARRLVADRTSGQLPGRALFHMGLEGITVDGPSNPWSDYAAPGRPPRS